MLNWGGIDIDQFLKEYWQKKPLLIRNAFPGFQSPIDPDDLAGLACEENVESRIVIERDNGKPWQVQYGPFDEDAFQNLPTDSPWTLLVQGLDYWVPEVSDLLEHFRFIPNWRIDDIMASYAVPGGSVGPHFDYYDVFLLQAQGRRNWKVGPICNGREPRVEGTPLRILQDFQTNEEWVLEPGDMLYLPPQYAHYGVAEDECITLSIGFRSPTHQEILSSWTDYIYGQIVDEIHLDDPHLQRQDNPGEIKPEVFQQVQDIILSYAQQKDRLIDWFGRYTTQAKHDGIVEPPEPQLTTETAKQLLAKGIPLRRNEGSRFSYTWLGDGLRFFVDGHSVQLQGPSATVAQALCQHNEFEPSEVQSWLADSECENLLLALLNQGSLYLEDDEE